jgi:hypothetical protein
MLAVPWLKVALTPLAIMAPFLRSRHPMSSEHAKHQTLFWFGIDDQLMYSTQYLHFKT